MYLMVNFEQLHSTLPCTVCSTHMYILCTVQRIKTQLIETVSYSTLSQIDFPIPAPDAKNEKTAVSYY